MHWRLERASKRLSRQGLYPFLEREVGSIPGGAAVLVVGAGGPIDELVRAGGARARFTVTSLDIDPARGPDVVGDLCAPAPPLARHHDAVVLAETLEHLHDPVQALRNVAAMLRPGGRLILTTPFLLGLHNRPRDFFRLTRYGLELLLDEFESVQIVERTGWAEAILILLTRHHREQAPRGRLLAAPLLTLAWAMMPLARAISRWAPSDTITTGYNVTARRPREAPPDRVAARVR